MPTFQSTSSFSRQSHKVLLGIRRSNIVMITRIGCLLAVAVSLLGVTRPQTIAMTFEPNWGQAGREITFLAHGSACSLLFDSEGVSMVRGHNAVRMKLLGANPSPSVTGYHLTEGRANYFIGTADQWVTGIPLYAGVQYAEVYPGVALVFYSHEGELEYDFTLAPRAQASQIALSFDGIDEMRIERGDLVLKAAWGEVRHRKPRIYQIVRGKRSEIGGHFAIRGPKEAGFEIDRYDNGNTLVIDPAITYGTFIGGSSAESAWALAADSAGSAYVAGETWLASAMAPFAFLVKLNPSGTTLLYVDYFGGKSRSSARGVGFDSGGNVYITGFTYSPDFPVTAGAYRSSSLGTANAFVVKVSASGSALVYSTLIGGAGANFAAGIAVDALGSAYIAGYTSSVALPVTSGALQKSYSGGMQDAFVAKLNSHGSGLIYCTYLGGAGNEIANGIAVDSAGQVHVVGYTDSTDFATTNPLYSKAAGQGDAFIAKLTANGDALVFATYLGGRLPDIATAVALDPSGNIYVTGATLSVDFPVTAGVYQSRNQGSYDTFLSKMDHMGTSLLYSTYLGGENSDQASGIAVDANGVAYIIGFTYSSHFPIQGLVSAPQGGQDAFVAAVGSAGSSLLWSTYLGGAADDQATGIALDPLGNVYVAGTTFSHAIQTTFGAYQTVNISDGSGFLIKLGNSPPQPVSVSPSSGSGSTQAFSFLFNDLNGASDLTVAQVAFNSAFSGAGACYINIDPVHNLLWLANDTLTAWAGPLITGSASSLQNSQCKLSGVGSSIASSGNNVTVTLALTFQSSFAGTKNIWAYAQNAAGQTSLWPQLGTWGVTVSTQPPQPVSVLPSSGSGSTQTFSFLFTDLNGASDLTVAQVAFNSVFSGAGACYINIDPVHNLLWLANDTLTAWAGPLITGSASSLQNSQCKLSGVGSSIA